MRCSIERIGGVQIHRNVCCCHQLENTTALGGSQLSLEVEGLAVHSQGKALLDQILTSPNLAQMAVLFHGDGWRPGLPPIHKGSVMYGDS